MQYTPAQPLEKPDTSLLFRMLRHVPAILIAMLTVYGLAEHHAVLAIVGVIAVLMFDLRLQRTAETPTETVGLKAANTDGGSFSQTASAAIPKDADHPKVFDGGINRFSRLTRQHHTDVARSSVR